jgi:palmitoyltransferase ZDHHC13/17
MDSKKEAAAIYDAETDSSDGGSDNQATEDPELAQQRAKRIDDLFTFVRFGNRSDTRETLTSAKDIHDDLVNERDPNGYTCVHWAAKKGDVEMLYILQSFNAKLNCQTLGDSRMYPVHWAASEGRIGALRFFLEQRQDMNCQDANGCTPVTLAVQHNKTASVAFLYKNGVDMTLADNNGDSPVHWAAYKGFSEMMGLLSYIVPRGIETGDKYGQTALHLAALRGNDDVLSFLLIECGADFLKRDKSNNTALDLAMKKQHLKCELALRKMVTPNFFSLAKSLFPTRIKEGKIFSAVFCASTEKEMANYPWRVVFISNFIASLITIRNMMDPFLVDLSVLHIMNLMFQTLWWVCFLMCLFKSPSVVNDDTDHSYDKALEMIGDANSEEGLPNLCHTCHVRRPLRSKHCKIQRVCINKFDHFCPFVGNTVGRDNYIYFFGLLVCHMICGALWLTTIFYLYKRESISWSLGFFAFYSCGWMCMLAGLLQYHYTLITQNLTTNEHMGLHKYDYLKDSYGMVDNPFEQGSKWGNFIYGLFPDTTQYYHRSEVLKGMGKSGETENLV